MVYQEDLEGYCFHHNLFLAIQDEIQIYSGAINYSQNQATNWWLAYIYPKTRINYRFPDDEFLKLADKDYRAGVIQDIGDASSSITAGIVEKLSSKH